MISQLLPMPSSKLSVAEKISSRSLDQWGIFSTNPEEIAQIETNSATTIVLHPKVNDLRRINKHLILINHKLQSQGLLVCHCETIEQRQQRLRKKFGWAAVLYLPFDFFFKRVAPKIKGLQWFYFALTDGRNRVLSKAEVLGRLHYCGFHVVKMEEVDNRLHLIMKKAKPPSTDPEPSYRLIYKKKIPGQHGKIVHIYKVRTMYPFSEYLRDFMLRRNGYATAGAGIGKIDRDFRITGWGRFLRKHWIDELPQVINILKGELKIVGIRPLSESFLAEYPPDFAAERAKFKTGLLPPYAAHIHKSIQEYIDSERKYLAAYQKHPFWTDFRYFFWIIYNILSNKIRSQ